MSEKPDTMGENQMKFRGSKLRARSSLAASPCSRCVELESIVREMVAHCEGGRVGTIGADRVYTRQINVKAVERWKRILSENSTK